MRHVILGGEGQLARAFGVRLGANGTSLSRAELNLTDASQLHDRLLQLEPEVVFNCAAYNAVDLAEENWQDAFAVNAWAMHELARTCAELDAVLVHISTDYVFGRDEQRRRPYTELDDPGPINLYGVSKWAGEQVVRSCWHKHIVVRTCGLYGAPAVSGKTNFVHTMLRLGREARPLKVVHDQVCTPTFIGDLTAAIMQLVDLRAFGLFHLTNAESCSWYEFARAIFALANWDVEVSPSSSAESSRKARRPAFSVLENRAYDSLRLPPLRSWRDALGDYMRDQVFPPRPR